MPTSQEEVWRYVDLDFDLAEFGLVDHPGDPLPESPYEAAIGPVSGRVRIIDGAVTSAEGEAVTEAASEPDGSFGLPVDLDRFSAANRAFGPQPVGIRGSRDHAAEPVLVEVHGTTGGVLAASRLVLSVDSQSELSVVVIYRSPPDSRIVAVPQIEADVGDGARLNLTTIQAWGYGTSAIAQQRIRLGRDATVRHGEVGVGAGLGRLHFFVDIAGPGAHAEVNGLYFGEDDQVLDYRAFINHQAPHTTSNMYLKGAVEDSSHSVFTGLIRIEEEAQNVDAYQTNRNLVLSADAGAESVPNLEILANDVRCGHGSTVGPLDEDQRYYLMSRGIDRIHADRLQVRGFFEEAIARLPHPSLAEPIRVAVNEKYVRAQEEGRL